jgi:hypothetical protein
VAKNATVVSVQVLGKNGQGTVSSLLTGLQWVVKDAKKHGKKSLVNMSLGIPSIAPSADTLDQAITAAAKGGLPIIVAAGNSARYLCSAKDQVASDHADPPLLSCDIVMHAMLSLLVTLMSTRWLHLTRRTLWILEVAMGNASPSLPQVRLLTFLTKDP